MTPEDTLNAFFASEDAPAHDVEFSLAVTEGIAKQRLYQTLTRRAAFAVALGAVAWAISPALGNLGGLLSSPIVLITAIVAGIGALTPKIMDRIPVLRATRS
jgi:hypothetical protein